MKIFAHHLLIDVKMSRVILNFSHHCQQNLRAHFSQNLESQWKSRTFSNFFKSDLPFHICQFPVLWSKCNSFCERHGSKLNWIARGAKQIYVDQNLASVSLTLDSRAWASLVTRAMMMLSLSLMSLTLVMKGQGRVFSYCPRPKLAKALSLSRDCPGAWPWLALAWPESPAVFELFTPHPAFHMWQEFWMARILTQFKL